MPNEDSIKTLTDGRKVKFFYQELPEDGCTSPKLETGEDNTPFYDLESVVLLSANQILTLGSPE
jgi:hypothetical protein